MSRNLQSELHKATALTFEGLAFMFAAPRADNEDGGEADESPVEAVAEVPFHGIFDGRLVLAARGRVLDEILGNMLGADVGRAPEEPGGAGTWSRIDAWGEVANVICGNVLLGIAGSHTFRLDPPRPLPAAPEWAATHGAGNAPAAEAHVVLETGFADAYLYIAGEVPALAGAAEATGEREGDPT